MKTYTLYCFSLILVFCLSWQEDYAQLTVTQGNTITLTPQQFVETYLVGAGVTITNATFNGSSSPINIIQTVAGSQENKQIGNFTTAGQATNQLKFTGGVILSSGFVSSASSPPTFANNTTNGPIGDADLAKIASVGTSSILDQAILEFDFTPQTDLINFRYVFGSEEFDDFCNFYNDAFGFFLSGPGIIGGMGYMNDAVNIAMLPASLLPVTINNICANKDLYSWWNKPEKNFAYNRLTFVFTAMNAVTCNETYHIKLAICDVGDRMWDSGVFLELNSFSSTGIVINTTFSNPGVGQNAVEGCSDAILVFAIPSIQATDYEIDLAISGASTANQADVLPNPLPATITIPAGQLESAPLVIQAIEDFVIEGLETLVLDASHTVCGITSTTTVSIVIKEKPPLLVSINPAPPGLICNNDVVSLTANVSGGFPTYSYLWTGGQTTNPASVIVSASSPTVTVRVADVCHDTTYANLTLTVTSVPGTAGPITGAPVICKPTTGVPYHLDAIAGATGYTWTCPPGVVAPPSPSPNDISLDYGVGASSGNLEVKGVNLCGSGPSTTIPITVYSRPAPTINPVPASVCIGTPVTYTTEAGMSNYQWTYTASSATYISGGTPTDNTLTIIWITAGSGLVTVNYNNTNNCSAISPTQLTVIVPVLPVPSISGNQSLCIGTTGVTYTTEAGMNDYSWTVSPGNTISPSGNTCLIDWLVPGSQWLKVRYQEPVSGCYSSPANPGLTVTVNSLPTPAISGTSTGCNGLSLGPFTTETGKTGYNWNPDGGSIVQGAGPYEIFITWITAGTKLVTVTYTDANNCQGTSPAHTVTVNTTPSVSFSSPAVPYCPNTPMFVLTFGSPAGGAYSGPGVINISGTYYFNPALANIGPNTINYTFTTPEGCQASASGTITLNPLPDVQFTPGHINQKWCSNDPVNIILGSSLGGTTFTWTASANPVTITPSSILNGSGNISQAFQNSGGITEPVQFQVSATAAGCTSSPYPYTVQINPHATISALPSSQVICSATSTSPVNFSLVPATGTSVSWSFTSSVNITPATGAGISNPVPATAFSNSGTVQESITYSVNTSYDNCPGNSIQYIILVNPKPTLTNSSLSQSVCLGGSSTQVDFISSVTYLTSYQWLATPSPASITGYTPGIQTTAFIPVQTLTDPSNSTGTVTYSITPRITVSSVTCSGDQQNYVIHTNPLPTPNIQTIQPVCELTNNVIYTTTNLINHLYQWTISGGTIISPTNVSSVTVNWGPAGSASISVTESINGTTPVCQSTDTRTIILLPRPVPTITPDYVLSNGICLLQTGNYHTESGMSNYTWTVTPGGNVTSQNNQNLSVNWIVSGAQTVSVNYDAINGCRSLAPSSINFNVNPLPDVTLSGPAPAVACQGLSSSFSVPADPNSSFTWSLLPSGTGSLITPQGQPTATFSWLAPASNASVNVNGLTSHGCTAANQVILDVHPTPAVSLDLCYDHVTIPSAKPFILHGGIPKGVAGIYTGEGVSLTGGQYQFNPGSVSGPFPKTVAIVYSYTNTYGCAASDTKTIQIVNAPAFLCENTLLPLKDVRTTPNRTYNTYWRGNRCWMIQNLDYGSEESAQQPQTNNCQPQKYCAAPDPGCNLYGGFYQWDELMQFSSQEGSQGLCPPGWHVPSSAEWQMLIDDPANQGNGLAGGYLKDIPFSPGLAGMLYMNNTWSFIQGESLTATMFWTSSINGPTKAWARGLNNFAPSVSLYSSSRQNAFPVRCVKD
ncbi:MAG: choice-of-anchor L domain-containing protein [Bacteroidetes bacterium]|nr:choice-of-anchor L domain-containing protein [Bacteroidota bacterium]